MKQTEVSPTTQEVENIVCTFMGAAFNIYCKFGSVYSLLLLPQ